MRAFDGEGKKGWCRTCYRGRGAPFPAWLIFVLANEKELMRSVKQGKRAEQHKKGGMEEEEERNGVLDWLHARCVSSVRPSDRAKAKQTQAGRQAVNFLPPLSHSHHH